MEVAIFPPMPTKIWKIATIGDSLTEGNARGAVLSENPSLPNTYQHYLFHRLKSHGIQTEIWNWGIGGQVISQICDRLDSVAPADVVLCMGGTNDTWRFSESVEGVEDEMSEDIIDWYQRSIPRLMNKHEELGLPRPLLIINAIPPIGNVKSIPKNMQNCILNVNRDLAKFVKELNNPNVKFFDIHTAMAGSDRYMRPGLTVLDGVHFTELGNQTCGEAMADNLVQYLK
jgi:lysophospholipase L1-like esterase